MQSLPALAGPVRPHGFVDATGLRAAFLGRESGELEAWIWPLKVFRAEPPRLGLMGQQLVPATTWDSTVFVAPDRVTWIYRRDATRVRWTLRVALDRPVMWSSFDVETPVPLRLEWTLTPEFSPQWPAALGARLVQPDADTGALLLSEELGRYAVLLGGPEIVWDFEASRSFPRRPITLAWDISADRAAKGPLVFVACGAEVSKEPLSEAARLGGDLAATGMSRLDRVQRAAREEFRWALDSDVEESVRSSAEWNHYLEGTARLECSDRRFEDAFLWAKVALRKAWVNVPSLGTGLVAGLAPAGPGERPGFGWFFDADAMIGGHALAMVGDVDGFASTLRFAASHQHASGKMMHELTLAAALCQWFEDYPYAYYKAEETPHFLVFLDRYRQLAGTETLARELFPAAARAFRWCQSNVDDAGLWDITRSGLGATEAGPLCGRLRSDVYIHGLWVAAARAFERTARALGHETLGLEAGAAADRGALAFELFWSAGLGCYGFGVELEGGVVADLSGYLGLPLAHGVGNPDRAKVSARRLNEPVLTSDWGTRMFAQDAAVYDPAHYNTGSVFPYLNDYVIRALFRSGLPEPGFQILASQVALTGFTGRGLIPEHLLGDTASEPERGVPHQVFSSSTILTSVIEGLMGLRTDDEVVTWEPWFPLGWGRCALRGVRILGRLLDVEWIRERAQGSALYRVTVTVGEGRPLALCFRPSLPPLSVPEEIPTPGVIRDTWTGEFRVVEGPAFSWEVPTFEPDAPSRRVRVTERMVTSDAVTWTLWGPGGGLVRMPFASDIAVEWDGADVDGAAVLVRFPGAKGFVAQRVTARIARARPPDGA